VRPAIRLGLFLALLLPAGCIPIEEAPLSANAIRQGQRVVVIVYPAPGPLIETSAAAAEAVPGLGMFMQSVRNDRTRENSVLFAKYWPKPWSAETLFYPALIKELSSSGYAGRWLMPADANLSPDDLRPLNAAKDVVDWYARYYEPPEPGSTPRDYSRFRSLDEALVFEVSLRYGLVIGDNGSAVPTLGGAAAIYRADTMREMWRHSEVVQDSSGARHIDDFRANPKDLAPKIEKLMPQLAHALAASLHTRTSRLEGVPLAPEVAPSTAAASAAASSATVRGIAPSTMTPVGVSTAAPWTPVGMPSSVMPPPGR
jgi:hypothetical protein